MRWTTAVGGINEGDGGDVGVRKNVVRNTKTRCVEWCEEGCGEAEGSGPSGIGKFG